MRREPTQRPGRAAFEVELEVEAEADEDELRDVVERSDRLLGALQEKKSP